MIDGPTDTTLHKKIEEAWKHGKIVASVCHGPAALLGPKIDGKSLVDGKEVRSLANIGSSTTDGWLAAQDLLRG